MPKNKLEISTLEGLELISWAKVRKDNHLALSEKLLEKITKFVYADKRSKKGKEVRHNFCDNCNTQFKTALGFHRHYPKCLESLGVKN